MDEPLDSELVVLRSGPALPELTALTASLRFSLLKPSAYSFTVTDFLGVKFP